jgi:hypothetical protein
MAGNRDLSERCEANRGYSAGIAWRATGFNIAQLAQSRRYPAQCIAERDRAEIGDATGQTHAGIYQHNHSRCRTEELTRPDISLSGRFYKKEWIKKPD